MNTCDFDWFIKAKITYRLRMARGKPDSERTKVFEKLVFARNSRDIQTQRTLIVFRAQIAVEKQHLGFFRREFDIKCLKRGDRIIKCEILDEVVPRNLFCGF